EVIDGLHEWVDLPVPVVAGDVVVKLLPQPLDHVRQRRVGWQEVKHDAAAKRRQVAKRPLRLVDDEVVEHEVDAPGTPVAAAELIDESDEEVRVLALPHHVDHLAGAGVEGAGEVALDVLAWSE